MNKNLTDVYDKLCTSPDPKMFKALAHSYKQLYEYCLELEYEYYLELEKENNHD